MLPDPLVQIYLYDLEIPLMDRLKNFVSFDRNDVQGCSINRALSAYDLISIFDPSSQIPVHTIRTLSLASNILQISHKIIDHPNPNTVSSKEHPPSSSAYKITIYAPISTTN